MHKTEFISREQRCEATARILETSTIPRLRVQARKVRECGVIPPECKGIMKPWACGVLACPRCRGMVQWRRLRDHNENVSALCRMFPAANLTLTVRNVEPNQLEQSIQQLRDGFNRMRQRAPYRYRNGRPLKAYAWNIEMTRARDGTAHPHLHAQVWMDDPPQSEEDLMNQWQSAAELDYLPLVNIDPGRPESWFRYITKPTFYATDDILQDPPFLLAAVAAVGEQRTFEVGGMLRGNRQPVTLVRPGTNTEPQTRLMGAT